MKYICPTHGEVEPKMFYYSCPGCAPCPHPGCKHIMKDQDDEGVRILTEEESKLKRPYLYDENGNFKVLKEKEDEK